MGELVGAIVAVAVVLAAAALMFRSWRGRRARDESLAAYAVPGGLAAPAFETETLYVATTPEAEPIERLAVEGLAFRGAARVEVHPSGLLLRIAGEQASFIPADRIVGAGAATYAIDRGVEPEGLVVVTWIVDEREPGPAPRRVDSYLRARYAGDAEHLIASIAAIAAAPTSTPATPAHDRESEASDD